MNTSATITWYPDNVWTLPNFMWYPWPTGHQQKCANCGFCPCCGRADDEDTSTEI